MTIEQIKIFMKERKITQVELSKKSGIPVSTIKKVFCGNSENPRLDTLNTICNALGLPLELPIQPTAINQDRRVISIGYGAPREEYELSEEDVAMITDIVLIVKNWINRKFSS